MVKKLLLPQEIEVFYVIPTIRKNLAVQMKAQGLKQKKIAELLHLEEAAVSQYLNNKRGNQISFSNEIISEIKASSSKIIDSLTLLGETQRIIKVVERSGELCKIHKQFSPVPQTCGLNVVNCGGNEDVPNTKIRL